MKTYIYVNRYRYKKLCKNTLHKDVQTSTTHVFLFLSLDNRMYLDLQKPKIMAQYRKRESVGSIGSIILAIWEVQVCLKSRHIL